MITARSQSLDVRNQLHQVTYDISISTRELQILLNTDASICPADTVLKLAENFSLPDSSGLELNPSLGYIEQQIEISKFEKNLERSRIMPDLNIGYFSQTIQGTQEVNGVPRNFGKDDRFTGLQAGIAIPLWIVPFTSKSKAAKINENIARADAEYYSKALTGQYRSLLDEYRKYYGSVNYYEQQAVPEADMIIEQSTKSYRAGAMDYLDYIFNLTRALNIRQGYLDALNNLNQTIINIHYITGRIL
jgi:cobalt-zinc-cadmium resistance protein CzcA